ncbi:anti-RNA polymerase sigma factor SigE [Salmonella enterica subsp. enterica]|uniref:Anti-RNA polymerase sigma factor SigE n=1 Tax=Salmonella enterica I TaxID=59201 RepID=A0A447TXT9_SALET|nr:anti-RNA polymerase sigma factor SigE [Salmonella enterica subsp. enterica]
MIIKFNRLSGVDDSGILEKVLGMQKEKLSALMDGETLDSELLKALTHDPEMQKNLGELSPDPRFNAGGYA